MTERWRKPWTQTILSFQWGVSADGPQQQRTDRSLFHCFRLRTANRSSCSCKITSNGRGLMLLDYGWSGQGLGAAWNHLACIKQVVEVWWQLEYFDCVSRFDRSFFQNADIKEMKEKWVQTSQARWRWSVGVASLHLWASGLTGGSCTLPELNLDQYHCKHLLTQLLVGIQVDKTQHEMDVLVRPYISSLQRELSSSQWHAN